MASFAPASRLRLLKPAGKGDNNSVDIKVRTEVERETMRYISFNSR